MIGDRRYPATDAVARSTAHPEQPATGDALASSLRSTYSYAQHAGVHLASWWAPLSRARDARIALGDVSSSAITITGAGVVRVLSAPCVLSAHWDRIIVSCWVGIAGLGDEVYGTTPLELDVNVGGGTSTAQLDITAEPLATGDGDHLPASLYRINATVDLDGITRDTLTSIVADLSRVDLVYVEPISCTAWAEVGT